MAREAAAGTAEANELVSLTVGAGIMMWGTREWHWWLLAVLASGMAYVTIAWMAFQFRYPTSNQSALVTHFLGVVLWR